MPAEPVNNTTAYRRALEARRGVARLLAAALQPASPALADLFALVHAARWPARLAGAVRHGVDGIVLAALNARPDMAATIPPDLLRAARANLLARRIRLNRLRDTLWQVLADATAAGLQVVPLKGPCLAARVWPAGSERPSDDLDVLVGPTQFDDARAWLQGRGWSPLQAGDARDAAASPHVAFRGPESSGGVLLELHRAPGVAFGLRWPVAEMLQRTVTWHPAGGPSCAVLAPADEWLVLAVHGAQHQFARLMWLADLALLPAPSLAVTALARSLGASAVLQFARHELATTPGIASADPLTADGIRQAVARTLAVAIRRGAPFSFAASLRRAAFQLCLTNRLDSLARFVRTASARLLRSGANS